MIYTVWVAVYEKNGLKRGPGLLDAFFALTEPWVADIDSVSGGGPLGQPVYKVAISIHPRFEGSIFGLEVLAPRHYPQRFLVPDGQSFEVRLDRMP
jgi:hypothetical protein